MKAFVTGATGFIGGHVARKLLERDYEVYALVRSPDKAADLAAAGAHLVVGDITDIASMREGMRGSDVVFHIAAWYKIGSDAWMKTETINVGGTRKVLRLAQELNVPKIVYTSTVAVFGNTRGRVADENYFQGGPFATEYDRTKWLAHYKVAVPMMEKGAPIIIVMPGAAYGPGDHSSVGQLMELFYQGKMPAVAAPEMTVTYAHVEDIAEGHILAAEKGKVGESYILAGPAVPQGEIVDFWSHITGKPAPVLRIPARFLKPLAPLVGMLSNILPLPEYVSEEMLRISDFTYMARANKARTELGWQPRSLQEGMSQTFRHIAGQESQPPPALTREKKLAGLALAAAFVLLILWLLDRRRK